MSEHVPKITDERLAELLARIRPVHRFDGELCYIKPVDPRRIAFTWDPKKDMRADGLVALQYVMTCHDYGHPSLFKPSVAEVLAQIPEDIVDEVVAFETSRDADFDRGLGCHVTTTIFYGRTAMSELLDRYHVLKRELIRVRDEHRLHGHATQDRECREEDAILDDMDIVWHKMSDEEHKELDGGWDCCCGSLNYLAREIAAWSADKGWETTWRSVPEKLMLVVTELAEAMEEYRHLQHADIAYMDDEDRPFAERVECPGLGQESRERVAKFREEISDTMIRLLNLSASLGIDIEAEIAAKMEKNEKRPYRHGGKNC